MLVEGFSQTLLVLNINLPEEKEKKEKGRRNGGRSGEGERKGKDQLAIKKVQFSIFF